MSIRFLVRELLLILLLARLDLSEDQVFYAAIACFIVFFGLQAPHGALVTLIASAAGCRSRPATSTWPPGSRIPDAPPRLLLAGATEKMLHLDLAAVVGPAGRRGRPTRSARLRRHRRHPGPGHAVRPRCSCRYLRRGGDPAERRQGPAARSTHWLREYRPETVLYFSGSKDSAYQVNMWLETMEQLDSRPLIILRERVILQKLGAHLGPCHLRARRGAPDEHGPVHGAGRAVLRRTSARTSTCCACRP